MGPLTRIMTAGARRAGELITPEQIGDILNRRKTVADAVAPHIVEAAVSGVTSETVAPKLRVPHRAWQNDETCVETVGPLGIFGTENPQEAQPHKSPDVNDFDIFRPENATRPDHITGPTPTIPRVARRPLEGSERPQALPAPYPNTETPRRLAGIFRASTEKPSLPETIDALKVREVLMLLQQCMNEGLQPSEPSLRIAFGLNASEMKGVRGYLELISEEYFAQTNMRPTLVEIQEQPKTSRPQGGVR